MQYNQIMHWGTRNPCTGPRDRDVLGSRDIAVLATRLRQGSSLIVHLSSVNALLGGLMLDRCV